MHPLILLNFIFRQSYVFGLAFVSQFCCLYASVSAATESFVFEIVSIDNNDLDTNLDKDESVLHGHRVLPVRASRVRCRVARQIFENFVSATNFVVRHLQSYRLQADRFALIERFMPIFPNSLRSLRLII